MKKKLLFVELHQETNSFSTVPTTLREFENFSLSYGEEVWAFADKYKAQAYGFRQAVRRWGQDEFAIVPVYAAWAWSGGPIAREVYEQFKTEAVTAVAEVANLTGIYVSLHGAMGVEDLRDPESDFLRAIRAVVGVDFPIAVSFDLHANVTEENIRLASFLVGYHTNPHRDFRRTGREAGRLLIGTVRGDMHPTMAWRKLPLLKGGGWGIDFLQPMRGIIRYMKRLEKRKAVLAAASFWVHIWIDDEELGWSAVVTTNNDPALAEQLVGELADRMWAVRARKHPQPKPVNEAIRIASQSWLRRKLGTVVFCDVSDIVGAGAPGANTNILAALLKQAPELYSYVPVRDPIAALAIWDTPQGEHVEIRVGGSIDPENNPPVDFSGDIVFRIDGAMGKTSIIRHQGLHLILSELPFTGYFRSDFTDLGINLWKTDIVVVKNLFPFRYRLALYNRRTVNVLTRGITNVDVHQLPYVKVPRPIYPLDEVKDWRG
ncbi:MAG: M81 family metallopeptidase [Bacteroidota bacterium]